MEDKLLVPKKVIEEALTITNELRNRTSKCGNRNDDWKWWLRTEKLKSNLQHCLRQRVIEEAEMGFVSEELEEEYLKEDKA